MRTEREIFDLILGIANKDERIRAVYMNGSRTNPMIEKDCYQDYDIVFVVTEMDSFLANKNWISIFGDLSIVQEPDSNELGFGLTHDATQSYAWLMLFQDGTRIDLSLKVFDCALTHYQNDSLCILLLDKDNTLPQLSASDDSTYWIQPPSIQKFAGCCNEFFWCLNNVAKGIARDQMPYALKMYHEVVHSQLVIMTEWYIGIGEDFYCTTGMWGKYFKKYLTPELYTQFLKTYSGSDYSSLWDAIFTACELFRFLALEVSAHFGFTYHMSDDENILSYLSTIKTASKDIF